MKKFLILTALLPLLLAGADIYLAGDSTMCNYPQPQKAPQFGWGMMLQKQCKPGIKVFNHAQGGRSSMSFITEKRWEKIRKSAKKGDFVIIQFGHNDAHCGEKNLYRSTDAKGTFKLYLKLYIAEARARGMIPVLCTKTAQCRFDKKGKAVIWRAPYIEACKEVAQETKCDFIDLHDFAIKEMNRMGEKKSEKLHMMFNPGEHPKVPKGRKDRCHLTAAGADFYAEAFVKLAKAQNLKIAELFK